MTVQAVDRPPTLAQLQVLAVIRAYTLGKGYPPTLREIGARLGIASTNGVNDHLRALERRGLLTRTRGISRGMRITPAGLGAIGE